MRSLGRPLFATLVAVALAYGLVIVNGGPVGTVHALTPTPTWTNTPTATGSETNTPTSTNTPLATPTPGDTTRFVVDAIPGGAIDATRTVTTGSSFSVDIILDEYAGVPWTAYQVTLDYEDPVLDPLFPIAWENAPTLDVAGGNVYSFAPFGPFCAPTNPLNSSAGTEDDVGFALVSMACLHDASGSPLPATSYTGVLVQLAFYCERPGVATLALRGVFDTFMLDPDFNTYNDEQLNATIECVGPSLSSIEKVPFGNANNVVAGELPLANLWLCEPDDDPGNDPDCDGSGEGRLIFSERATTLDTPLGAFEFQIKFDHKIFDINMACVTEADPDPACSLPDTATWDIFLGAFLIDGEDMGREWGMDQCFRNVTENYINFACTSTGAPDAGRTGTFEIAIVRLHPDPDLKFRLRPGNDNGVVRVILDENCELIDPLGHPVMGSIAGGLTPICGDLAVTVRILEGDLNLDCTVDLADAQTIAQRYGMTFGLFLYDPWYDLEPNITDFDIDAKDVQKVFGRIGSTCQDPIPPQPPVAPPQA